MGYEKEKEVAIAAVRMAAKLCQQVRQENGSKTMHKADESPVTVADFGAQAVICSFLEREFATDPIVGEESASMLQKPENKDRLEQITTYVKNLLPHATSEDIIHWINRGNAGTIESVPSRYWTLDPIDGTKGFIRGDQYAIALALIEDGEVKVGILGCPALPLNPTNPNSKKGVLFVAVKEEGTTQMSLDGTDFKLIQVNSISDRNRLRFIASVESSHSDQSQQKAIANSLGLTLPPIRMDSQAKYGSVARGEADLYLRIPRPESASYRQNIWDHAAGAIVVEEAGGKVTDLDGKPLDFSAGTKLNNNYGIVATNGIIHSDVLKIWAELS
ncbi:MAG: 3'(2'),5'-bisphosphate nucleotidase [Halothece sp.]